MARYHFPDTGKTVEAENSKAAKAKLLVKPIVKVKPVAKSKD